MANWSVQTAQVAKRFAVICLLLLLAANLMGKAIAAPIAAQECLLDWAEKTYPTLLSAPAKPQSARLDKYYYRYYSGSNAFAAVGDDNRAYYYAPLATPILGDPRITDLGAATQWYTTAGCPAQTGFSLKGFNFSAFDQNAWSSATQNEAALQWAISAGANMITVDWLVQFADDGSMLTNGGSAAPPWSDIASVVSRAKALGMYVILKPHVASPVCCGQNRNLSNTNTSTFLSSTFFPAWQAYLISMIANVPVSQVDAIAIGTELNMFDWQNRADWATLISAVRNRFSGALTYDAMFSQYPDSKDIGAVVFWDLLDFVSTSYYVRLTQDNAASVETVAALMRANPNVPVTDAIAYLKQVGDKYGKKVMVIEGGYQSANGALWAVNADYPGATTVENQDLQARGLDGYLQALNAAQGTWLMGVNLWDLQSRYVLSSTWQDANYRVGWGMYGKSSAEVVKRWYTLR